MFKNKSIQVLKIALLGIFLFSSDLMAQKRKPAVKAKSEISNQLVSEHFMEGQKHFMLEDYPRAYTSFKKAYDIDPTNEAVCFKLGEVLNFMGKQDEGIPYAEKALTFNEKNKYYYTLLADMYKRTNKLNDAARVYQKMLKNVPGAIEYNLELANVYLFLGKYDEALACYIKVEDVYGISEEITRNKQHIYLKENKIDKAIEAGKKLAQTYPDEPSYILAYCEIMINNNRQKEAQTVLSQLVKDRPDFPMARLVLHDVYKAAGETEKADAELKMAFESPDLPAEQKVNIIINFARYPDESHYQIAMTLNEIATKVHPYDSKLFSLYGDLLAGKKQFAEARRHYSKSVALDNSAYEVWRQLVYIDFQTEQYDSARATSEAALELFPNQGEMWMLNGEAWLIQKNYREASKSLEQAKKLLKSDPAMLGEVLAALGDSYNYTKEYVKSDQSYEEALTLNPDNHRVLNNYAYFLSLRKDKLEKAKKMSSRLAIDHPDNATYLDTHGWVLYISGEYEEAKKYLEKAVKSSEAVGDSPSGEVLEHFGDVLYKTGDKKLALEYWKKAAEKGETTEQLQRKIAEKKLYED